MAHSESHQLLVLCNLIATTIWIALNYETSLALDKPYHLALGVVGFSGLAFSVLSKVLQNPKVTINDNDNAHFKQQLEIDLEEQKYGGTSNVGQIVRKVLRLPSRTERSSVILVACIILRALILRSIVHGTECSLNGVENFLLVLICLPEYFSDYSHLLSITRLEGLSPPSRQPSRFHNLRYVLLAAVWSVSAYGSILLSTNHSTYICPEASNLRNWIRMLQILGVVLDVMIINLLSKLAKDGATSGRLWKHLSQLSFVTGWIMLAIGCLFLWWNPPYNHTPRYVNWHFFPVTKQTLSLLSASLLGTNFVLSSVYLLSELRAATIVATTSCINLFAYQFDSSTADFLFIPKRAVFCLCLLWFAAAFGMLRLEREFSKAQNFHSMNLKTSKYFITFFVLLSISFCWHKYTLLSTGVNLPTHPITTLIASARSTSSNWERQASKSVSLKEAVTEYQRRYRIPPPPHFDKWWDYAMAKDCIVTDDYNQIHEDLLPFWGMEPFAIRNITAHMIERQWTEVAGLRISNGTTLVGPHMPGTHRWMVDGAADMINKFVEWLPDMDLGFNINDESRVAVPWHEMENYKARAKISRGKLSHAKKLKTFSTDYLWSDRFIEPEPPYPPDHASPHFKEASLRSSFMDYGVIGCPPQSPSQQKTWWMKNTFCHECTKPHSIGPIVSNWTLSGSLCHQPDLANLHGFHLSPSSFKPTKKLLPIFSQSKIPTFSDIIFPSPWNYRDKVVYNETLDMSYSLKDRTAFWRGATSEGYGIRGSWQGMQRQRFVHMTNYTPPFSTVNLLIPNKNNGIGYFQKSTSITEIALVTNISVSFVGEPTRCYGPDCDLQAREFNFGGSVDFQDHWKYKFLFDLDGAGFSGRFLPFLESKSLVFRAAGFRQWFDERLVAWRHFVPVDGRLHDVWHLIAYFGGTKKGLGGDNGNGHDHEGEQIAEEGKLWAGKVLRKEDMEVYMFRLLLEWGRIVDDRREELGFVLKS